MAMLTVCEAPMQMNNFIFILRSSKMKSSTTCLIRVRLVVVTHYPGYLWFKSAHSNYFPYVTASYFSIYLAVP
ncbi:hypothetical protein XELAEV_18018406mg [Xenopus laevis]|uniref:Uncharacterized protein n=1 Tax=Xenopus laevis TaxID=8355 RepID=A0A974HTR6_XENLA|nr:hypothetical protein XELAEV_18018406mg [Xenopus laevis]